MKEQILLILLKIVKELTNEELTISLEIPTDMLHGDYATNISFSVAKILKKSPLLVAQDIVTRFEKEEARDIERIEVANPGFINFYLSKQYLISQLSQVINIEKKTSITTKFKNRKISVEFTDPNPFKEFHIGHLYTNTVGESLSRIFEANGATVWRANYFGDVGMHVAKAIYGIKKQKLVTNEIEKLSLSEKAKLLGECYALGAQSFEDNDSAKEEIKYINKLVYIAAQQMWEKEKNITPQIDYTKGEKIDKNTLEEVYRIYTLGREWSLAYFETIYKRLGMQFDGYYPESIAGERGYKLVQAHIEDGIFMQHDGAIIFSKEKHGLHTRVFINSLGLPTYEAKELGLAPWKYEEFPYDISLILTGSEINEYFKVLIKALTLINPKLGEKTHHIGHGMVRLPEGKMSSRTGNVLTGEWLLDEAVKKAEKLNRDLTDKAIPEQVAIGAVKYAFLKSSIGKDIEFDLETSLSLNGNSGPYIQYTYARIQSLLLKVTNQEDIKLSYDPTLEEIALLRRLHQFREVVEKSAMNYSPSAICTYLYDLAGEFNLFYQKHRILNADTPEAVNFRLKLSLGIGEILSLGLYLLGIEAPKRM